MNHAIITLLCAVLVRPLRSPRVGEDTVRHLAPTQSRLEELSRSQKAIGVSPSRRSRSFRKLTPGYRTGKSTKSIKRPDGDEEEYQMQVNLISGAHR